MGDGERLEPSPSGGGALHGGGGHRRGGAEQHQTHPQPLHCGESAAEILEVIFFLCFSLLFNPTNIPIIVLITVFAGV